MTGFLANPVGTLPGGYTHRVGIKVENPTHGYPLRTLGTTTNPSTETKKDPGFENEILEIEYSASAVYKRVRLVEYYVSLHRIVAVLVILLHIAQIQQLQSGFLQ